jgi:hypothetical protein
MNKLSVSAIKVKLKKPFPIVRESLDRIGIANKEKKILNPSCYLLHKFMLNDEHEYFVIHFKNLLKLDGKKTNYSEEDNIRQASIARLLENWGLVEIVNEESLPEENVFVFVLPFNDKGEWSIKHKYRIGEQK